MHEERGFLDQLREHPEDDVTRLVYADWLEDRDDPRSAYLRAEVALARMAEGDEGYADAEAELARLREGLELPWLERVGKRWDVVFQGHRPKRKILAIHFVRVVVGEVVGIGEQYDLGDSLRLVSSAPSIILIATIRSVAEYVRVKSRTNFSEAKIQVGIVPNNGEVKEYLYEAHGFSVKPIRWHPSA